MANVLIIDDDPAMREGLSEALTDLGHTPQMASSGREGLAALSEKVEAVLLDLNMPGMDGIEVLRRIRSQESPPAVVVLTAFASAENTIEAMRLGAFDHLTKPIGRDELKDLLERVPSRRPPVATASKGSLDTLIGSSAGMRRVQKAIGLAADSQSTVLILGETGTGKELVARALHVHSQRKEGPFIAVNCAAIPPDLLESELFGHVKGSFTGATGDRTGAFRDADGGTLFLDEIGDMPLAMQAKILRVLQERMMTPVGGKPVRTTARVVTATHRDLPKLVAAGAFREDLYYRLNVVPIAIPPLRERPSDIVALAEHFLSLSVASGQPIKQFDSGAIDKLTRYDWPGNVRQLRNVIERACVLTRSHTIGADDIDTSAEENRSGPAGLPVSDLPTAVAQLEEAMIRRTLDACGGNRAETARRLNINRQLLYTKMQRYGLAAGDPSENPTPGVGKDDD
jgi:two-component system NtrC family response regulator